MGAIPARPLKQVRYSSINNDVIVVFAETNHNEPIDRIPRAELCRVASRIGIKPKDRHGVWKTNEQLVAAIRNEIGYSDTGRDIPEPTAKPTPWAPVKVDDVTLETVDGDTVTVPVVDIPTVDVHVAKPTNAAAAAAQALIDALGAQNTIDEPAVRAIAEDVAANVFAELVDGVIRPIEIKLGERPTVTINEATHARFADVLDLVSVGVHPFLVGPPGTGKSTLAHQVATALGRDYGSVSLNPQMAISQLIGFVDATGTYRGTPFRKCFEHGGVFLLDEIDNGHPGVIATLNAALANGVCAFADQMVKRHPDFVCIAAANTYGTGPTASFVGRTQLDAATLDRFARVEIGYDETLETHMVNSVLSDSSKATSWLVKVRQMRANVEREALRLFVTPRTSIDGAKLIAIGWSERKCADAKILAGLTSDMRDKVIDGIRW